ncbi:MAG TPA: hypothetical protein VHB79_37560 [Polyangiaceae bacterium]|nr:hypothetical protein [Polyangiaceae bacterium]
MFECRSPRWVVALALSALVPCVSVHAQASQEEARRYFKNGVDLMTGAQPNYQDAYYQFQLAYRESAQSWKVLGNLGLCALKLERDQEAVDYYERYLDKGGTDIAPEERNAIEQDLLLLKGNLATVHITSPIKDLKVMDQRAGSAAPAQVYVLSGGKLELSLRAGNHTLSASSGEKRLGWEVVLEPKADASHVFDFDAEPKPAAGATLASGATPAADKAPGSSGMRVASYAALGAGALGLGLGGFFLWQSSSYANDSDTTFAKCNPGCTTEQQAQVRSYEDDSNGARTRGFVALGVGGALAATGVVLLLLSSDKSATTDHASLTPWVGYRAAGVSGRF